MGKSRCLVCKKKCKGDVLIVDDAIFHSICFSCNSCKKPLSQTGYIQQKDTYYCPEHYHAKFGSRCANCKSYIEGEGVQCAGQVFHQACFRCDRCKQPLSAGQRAVYTSTMEHLCPKCSTIPIATVRPTQVCLGSTCSDIGDFSSPTRVCVACDHVINSDQILFALDTYWHISCFKCVICGVVLQGEYMTKDYLPYCTKDYTLQFGVKCHECREYIVGKVLQAGEYNFHPSCALCSRCNLNFEESEEMYMQGDEIWHARCNDHSSGRSMLKSPSLSKYGGDFGKFLTYMYLLPGGEVNYLRHPIAPHPPPVKQFHVPLSNVVKLRRSRISMFKSGLQKLAEILDEQQPRRKSPHMNNEEPIELSQYPSGRAPFPNETPAIERDDFPAPPYPYAVEELKRRLPSSDMKNEVDQIASPIIDKITKVEQQLNKIGNQSSLAKVIVMDLEESIRRKKSPLFWDPRSASRTPSAKKLPQLKCRYDSPVNASPSRYLTRPRPWELWIKKSVTTTMPYPYFTQAPKPGYSLTAKATSLPGYYLHDFGLIELDSTRSSTLSDKTNLPTPINFDYGRFQSSDENGAIRSSLPDMNRPLKTYTYTLLSTTNKKLPADVNRCHLERHLSKEEFMSIFSMMPIEFYRLPEWKRINLKRLHNLY